MLNHILVKKLGCDFINSANLIFFILALLSFANVFSSVLKRRFYRWLLPAIFAMLTVFAAVEVDFGLIINLGAILSFSLLFVFTPAKKDWARIVLSSVLGGILAWKLCDRFPLFFELGILCALPTVILSLIFCKSIGSRILTALTAPLIARLILSAADQVLFDFAIVNIGGDWAISGQAISCLVIVAAEVIKLELTAFRLSKRVALSNQQ